MENKDFIVFILTHGRPYKIRTLKLLRARGYTGKVYFIVDNEDKTINKYIKIFGKENVKIFDKKYYVENVDNGNNFGGHRAIIYARNACFDIARELGYTYFIALDDDYYSLGYRYIEGERKIKNLDKIFDIILNFYKKINAKSIAFAQNGDFIGGFSGIKLKRKCMNSFICSVERPFKFIGALNEDVNTYTLLGSRGDLFLTFTNISLAQKDTQSQGGGMTPSYLKRGTYCKAFTTVMMYPSGTKVSLMNSKYKRIHHSIRWKNTTPKIMDERHKKY